MSTELQPQSLLWMSSQMFMYDYVFMEDFPKRNDRPTSWMVKVYIDALLWTIIPSICRTSTSPIMCFHFLNVTLVGLPVAKQVSVTFAPAPSSKFPGVTSTSGASKRIQWKVWKVGVLIKLSSCIVVNLKLLLSIELLPLHTKGTATPMANTDPVFNLRFWRIWR